MEDSLGPWSSVADIVACVTSRNTKARDIADVALERAHKVQAALNCFMEIDDRGIRDAADAVDARIAQGQDVGPLAGVPVVIKDCTPVAGLGNRMGSMAFKDTIAEADAVIVERFRKAGALILGKTTLPEFASSSFCDAPIHGVTRNPWDPTKTPGGSSGGSAVAVATGCAAIGHGTDMGGSVRIPASFTGLLGIKPSFGRIPLDDQPTFVDDIQHHGLLTRTASDLEIALSAVSGPDMSDPRSLWLLEIQPSRDVVLDELRVAISRDLGFFAVTNEVSDRVHETASWLKDRVAQVDKVELGWTRKIADGWVRHWHVYLAAFFGDTLDSLGNDADPNLVAAVTKGRGYTAVEVKQLELLRKQQWDIVRPLLEKYDVILSPTMTRPAVSVDDTDATYHRQTNGGRKHGLDMTSVFNWIPWCPSISVPGGMSQDGLPIGIHLLAPPGREDVLVRMATAFQEVWPFQEPTIR